MDSLLSLINVCGSHFLDCGLMSFRNEQGKKAANSTASACDIREGSAPYGKAVILLRSRTKLSPVMRSFPGHLVTPFQGSNPLGEKGRAIRRLNPIYGSKSFLKKSRNAATHSELEKWNEVERSG